MAGQILIVHSARSMMSLALANVISEAGGFEALVKAIGAHPAEKLPEAGRRANESLAGLG